MRTTGFSFAVLAALVAVCHGIARADSPGEVLAREEAAAELGGALADAWKKEIEFGPFTFTAGPQEGGGFGAVLKGEGSTPVKWLNSEPPSVDELKSGDSMLMRYGLLEFSVDANWASPEGAKNQTSLSLKPQLTFSFLKGAEWQEEIGNRVTEELCAPVAAQVAFLVDETAKPDEAMAALIRHYKLDQMTRGELLGLFQGRDCNVVTGKPPRQRIAVGIYPDIRYRFGQFDLGGTTYDANQLILGGGARVFFPSATRHPVFREAPRLSVGYYTVDEDEDSTIPLPDDVKADFLQVDGRVLLRVPFPGHEISASPLQLDLEVTATKATTGGADWEALWKAQLSIQTEGEFMPALTYRSGKETGFDYDKQLILGFLWQLATGK